MGEHVHLTIDMKEARAFRKMKSYAWILLDKYCSTRACIKNEKCPVEEICKDMRNNYSR